jgi:hypothetical protein
MTDEELELLKRILPREMEVLHYGPRKDGLGKEGILRWRVGRDVGHIDVPLNSNPIENQITVLTNKAIEYGEQKGRRWASTQLKQVLQW